MPHTVAGCWGKKLEGADPKCDLMIISQICVCAIHRMNVRTEIARPPLFQMSQIILNLRAIEWFQLSAL